jgi:mono/diheme cytochrome c family protein
VRGWTRVAVLIVVALAAKGLCAQTPSKKPVVKPASTAPAPLSTLSGVYTEEQAQRGREVYASSCRSCHTPASHTGETFNKWWRGKRLSDLFSFVATRMPKNDPGSLAVEDVADVVAYLMKMNAMPVGKEEMYPDADSLKKFKIEAKRSSSTSTATRKKP